jgi:RNA polymerase sigma-70 factor, Bacteroides expansion family 1
MPLPQPGNGTGNPHADASGFFATLFKQFYPPLVYFARKLVSDSLVAEDIVTEVFIKYWQRKEQIDCPKAARSFLYVSARNACINHLEQVKQQARVHQTLRAISDEHMDHVLNEISRAEVLREVFDLVESLPVQCRKIVLMSYVAGLTNRQIARRLQLSVHTVRNQKVRGIRLMRTRAQIRA